MSKCSGCGRPTTTFAKAHKMVGPRIVSKLVPLHLRHSCADLYDRKPSMWTIARRKQEEAHS